MKFTDWYEVEKDAKVLIVEKNTETIEQYKNNKYDYIYLNNIANTIDVYNTDKVSVGRIRKGIDNKSMWIYCTADNLRIGASSNALKILKKMIS